MSEHICFNCRYSYCAMALRKFKCVNEASEKYGEDVKPKETCNLWQANERKNNVYKA